MHLKKEKEAIAKSKAIAIDELYEKLETAEDQNSIHSIAKSRDKFSKDFTHIREIKDKNGRILYRSYMERIL